MVSPLLMERLPPMRIAMMLESDGPGGAEVVVLHLAEELRRRGHTIIPVGPRQGVGWLGARFRALGFEPETFRISRPIDPDCVRSLTEIFRARAVDLVHSHEFTMGVYGTAAARLLRLPHVISWHGSSTMCKRFRRRVAVRWAMRRSHASVAVSEATRAQLARDLGVPESMMTVVHNGVPVRGGDPEAVRRELSIQPRDVVVLAVGNLDVRKGHMLLLRALQELTDEGIDVPWRLVIAGGRGGDQRELLIEHARAHGLSDRVHILSQREDIPDLLAASAIFAMPSLWEGLPMAMLEAMVAGRAIVASATGGIPEAIVDGEQGLLIQPGRVPSLKEALRRMFLDVPARERMAAAARTRGHERFTLSVMGDSYERVYAGALRAATGHSPAKGTLATASR
ncbi:MAG TPA: glycosyltransferase family 4 protein [Gemmatimonadaceae bacterium]|nr:glycosyltransferase family 4 protein [Gemmatimonadaceae bacterium]